MGAFLVYIIKSAVCLAVFYLFYRLLLSKETFHRFNRVVLLGILAWSCILPLAEVTVKEPMGVNRQIQTLEGLLLMPKPDNRAVAGGGPASEPAFPWRECVLLVYGAGVVFFFFRNLWSLVCMLRLIRGGRTVKRENGIVLVVHRKDIAPFSWMRFVVISEKDLEENSREILVHEYAHVRCCHSVDLLVADCCILLQWFNPASWLLKQELQNIHEYEADESVIKQGVDARRYQLLLIKKAVGTRLYSMANSLNHSSLKKRIAMMLKEKSSPWACLKYLYVLPLAAFAVAAFARHEVAKELDAISDAEINGLAVNMKADKVKSVENQALEETFLAVEQMPEFPGGIRECLNFLTSNIEYPIVSQENGVQGRVIVQFVIEKDGCLTDPQVVRSVDPFLDAEALRVVRLMPRWKPGTQRGRAVRVRYTIPISFNLGDGNETAGTGRVPQG